MNYEAQSSLAVSVLEQGLIHDPTLDVILPVIDAANFTKFIKTSWQARLPQTGTLGPILSSVKGVRVDLEIGIKTAVFRAVSLTLDQVQFLASAAAKFDFAKLETDGTKYILEIEEEIDAAGIGRFDYYVILATTVRRLNEVVAFDTFPSLQDACGETYSLYQIGETCELSLPDSDLSESEVVVSDIDDIGEINAKLDDEIAEAAAKVNCEGLEYRHKRIGTLFQFPEYKTEWEKKKLKIGKCTVIQIPWPYTYTRTRKMVLYISVAIPASVIQAIENAVVDCIIESAAAIGLLVLITGGMSLSAATLVFEEVFTRCIKRKLGDVVQCLVEELYIVAEYNDWHKI